jgi:hypothetical protein
MYTAEAKDLKEELFEIVTLIETHLYANEEQDEMSLYEKFKIALEMQYNRLYMEANNLGKGEPSALEKLSRR